MDACYTGNKIATLRKQQGLTQKGLAEKLQVTDKAVSKWERGLNFPDIALLERLADALETSVVELLGMEHHSAAEVATDMADLAIQEKDALLRDIINRGWITVCIGILLLGCAIYVSNIMAQHGIFGLPQGASSGMSGFIGLIIANGLRSVYNGSKLRKQH